MTVLVNDSDFTLHVGDVREQLALLPDGSVDCCVTSPPYWGLRDYGTGVWTGGDPDCDHAPVSGIQGSSEASLRADRTFTGSKPQGQTCSRCGAQRQDQQLGLEPTPDEYVANMVKVFREVRRVLAGHGTCWLNLGDSYAAMSTGGGGGAGFSTLDGTHHDKRRGARFSAAPRRLPGLKPKDLVGIPWRVAFALQADGWYLRADIVWSKPNPMPESVADRPTKSHEYVFLLSKRPRYHFDQEAVREPLGRPELLGSTRLKGVAGLNGQRGDVGRYSDYANPAGRNVRSVWEIPTQPYAEAHFATYPEELVRRCVLAGCPVRVCVTCGKPSERIVEREVFGKAHSGTKYDYTAQGGPLSGSRQAYRAAGLEGPPPPVTIGWSDCRHNTWRPGTVLDPFLGSGTTALVARKHGRRCVGIELNPEYAELALRRNAQQTIFAEGAA